MLIRFVVENFKSFKEETEFNLLTGSIRKHPKHVHHTKQGIDILPVSIIYGGNASGKSNLMKAIFEARQLIVDGTQFKDEDLRVDKFAFDNNDSFYKPTTFEFEFNTEKEIYSYGVVFHHFEVKEEWLYSVLGEKKDKLLFERNGQNIKFAEEYMKNKKNRLFLQNEVRGLRKNQFFLTAAYMREVNFFDEAYEWFQNLFIVFPEQKFSKLNSFYDENFLAFTNALLAVGDTGISIEIRAVDYNKLIKDNPDIREIVRNNLSTVQNHGLAIEAANKIIYNVFYNKSSKKNEVVKLVTLHPNKDYGNTIFETYQESDGTQRLIDLAGVLYPAIYENRVVFIDEIDRSFHPLLSKKIIEIFLQKRTEINGTGQLICTTHEDLIIDMNILRPDEVWFVQKKDDGTSEIYPLSDFKIRYDIDIRRGYLGGRFGAIPAIDDILFKKSA